LEEQTDVEVLAGIGVSVDVIRGMVDTAKELLMNEGRFSGGDSKEANKREFW